MKTKNNRIAFAAFVMLGLTVITLPAAVSITSGTQTISAEANDNTSATSGSDLDIQSSTSLLSSSVASANQGISTARALLNFTPDTILPTDFNEDISALTLNFSSELNASVQSGSIGSSAAATSSFSFVLEVAEGSIAEAAFTATGSSPQSLFSVAGTNATNLVQTLILDAGSHTISFSDSVTSASSEQTNNQNYTLSIEEVSFVPIPEPSGISLFTLAGVVSLLFRRR